MLTTGTELQNRYRIVSSLGQGGMGVVYRAWDIRLKGPVALKEMTPQPGLDPYTLTQLRQQFEQEAVVLAQLDHPHLVNVTDFFEEGGNTYLVMDFVEGESLADRIQREGALPEDQVLEWAEQLLDALGYCHAQGIIHRDVKPQNVIITPSPGVGGGGRAVLVDFGLVKLWDPHDPRTKTAMRGMGTPEYAPPEQYSTQTGHTGPYSDLYSLGATLYHALTGQSPLTATDRMSDPDQFVAVRRWNRRVSPRTDAAVLRAMELPRGKRFQSVQEMTAALSGEAHASDHPTTSKRRPTQVMQKTQPIARPKRSVPTWVWVLGGVVLVGGGIGLALIVGLVMMTGPGPQTPATTAPTAAPTQSVATPRPIETEVATESPGGGGFQLKVSNETSADICYVLISPSAADEWGDDWLRSEETIKVGQTRVFDIPGEPHDAMFLDCDEAVLATIFDVGSDFTLTIGGAGLVELVAYNESSIELCYIYISPTTSDDWGDDWLGDKEVISPGDGIRIFYVAPGVYDLLARDCDGEDVAAENEIELDSQTDWTISD